ncbi:hypothetical protein LYSBPC_24170 [Lysinibacillus piscis]|uniref:DUF2197 domain-containing protein n=1 Tax=Lysinibacillus piscis TaxID=2518931 RepID=A0ABQ5NLQ9_9BACI|nr:hypothetical protein LYSBPC_24170 [Lysinibacillus sp. KH24]
MYYYLAKCFCCKQEFKILEGTLKFQEYKRNRDGKYSCDDCNQKIEMEARKALFQKLNF